MSGRVSVASSVQAFARLCAQLDDPFADRAAILSAVDLDEAGFDRLRDGWAARLVERDAELGGAFGDAYSSERASRGEAPADDADTTGALDVSLLFKPVIPFHGRRRDPFPPSCAPVARPADADEGETLCDSAAPRRRLVQFDTQTGERLPVPRWEELSSPGDAKNAR